MDLQKLTVALRKPSDADLVRNLLNHYIYDMSEWFNIDPDDDGFFSYDLPDENSEKQFVYIAKYGNSPVGISIIDKDNEQFDMKEFFVLRRYRGTGTAQLFFENILARLPGRWQIRVLDANKPAALFWKQAISKLTASQYDERHLNLDGKPWTHYYFLFPISRRDQPRR